MTQGIEVTRDGAVMAAAFESTGKEKRDYQRDV